MVAHQYKIREEKYESEELNLDHNISSIKNAKIKQINKSDGDIVGIIYLVTNKINNKKYVGQTTMTLSKRINGHKRGKCNEHLRKSYNKYGFENFEFKIIDTAQTIDELNSKEIKYIIQYKTKDKNLGYNIESGGNNLKTTEETKLKQSKSHKGIKQSETWIKKRIAAKDTDEAKKYGKIKTDEEKKYLSENSPKYWLNKCRSEETKNKISKTKKEKGLSTKQKEASMKTVYVFDVKTNKLKYKFESTRIASGHYCCNQSTISRYCQKEKIINSEQFTYNSEFYNV